jgi:hypothetical protein
LFPELRFDVVVWSLGESRKETVVAVVMMLVLGWLLGSRAVAGWNIPKRLFSTHEFDAYLRVYGRGVSAGELATRCYSPRGRSNTRKLEQCNDES